MVCLTMDGDFQIVAEAGVSKVGVAFPCFDVFSGGETISSGQSQCVFVPLHFYHSLHRAIVCTGVAADHCVMVHMTTIRFFLQCRICSMGIEERLELASKDNRAQSMEIQVVHLLQVLKSIQSTSPVRVMCGMSTDASYMHIVPTFKKESSIYDHEAISNTMAIDYKIPTIENE